MVDKKQFQQHFMNILDLLKLRPKCKLIVIGISPTSTKMQERYPGINWEITLYNQVLKSAVHYKSVYYFDMEKHVKPQRSDKYLLSDDHHLNRQGNQLVAHELINLLKGFIESDFGGDSYNQGDLQNAIKFFEKSFDSHSLNTNNIFNLMAAYYENDDWEKLKELIGYCKKYKITDVGIEEMINFFESENHIG